MNPGLNYIGSNIRRFRKNRKWTQEELASRAHISRIALIHIENGKAVPTLDSLAALANVFEVSLVTLLSAVREPKEQTPAVEQYGAQERIQGSSQLENTNHSVESEVLLLCESLRGCTLGQLVAVRRIVDFVLAAFTSR